MPRHSKRQSPSIGRIELECETCMGARMTITEREAAESTPACPMCLEPMVPVRTRLVRHTGRRR